MALLNFDSSVNPSSTIGTWLGSLFTDVGLVAVVSQLKSFLENTSASREHFVSRAAGAWRICFLNKQIFQREGLIEEVAPALLGWLQRQYLGAGIIKLTQSDTGMAGTSSWSKYFAQCHISPQELVRCGGLDAQVYPTSSKITRPPIQADVRIEDGKLLYGLAPAEFAALLILSGFPPAELSSDNGATSVKILGTIRLARHGVFSQIAHFDPHSGVEVLRPGDERFVHCVPVQGAIHMALGILKLTPKQGSRQWIILPKHCSASEAWRNQPSANQLGSIRYNMEQLVMVSGGDVIAYSA